jgi:hypothetical protein
MMGTQKKINSKTSLIILIKFTRQYGRFNNAKTNEIYIYIYIYITNRENTKTSALNYFPQQSKHNF